MSFMYYDGSIVARMDLNRALSVYRRFDDFWGTTYIDGVKVYNASMIFYTRTYRDDRTIKKFVKSLGMTWETFTGSKVDREIENMYFKFKPGFAYSGEVANREVIQVEAEGRKTSPLAAPTLEEIRSKLNLVFSGTDEIAVTTSYGGITKKYLENHELEWDIGPTGVTTTPLNVEELRKVLDSDPWFYYANSRFSDKGSVTIDASHYDGSGNGIITKDTKTPSTIGVCNTGSTVNILGTLALLDSQSEVFTLLNEAYDEEVNAVKGTHDIYYTEYKFTRTYKFNKITGSSTFLNMLLDWYSYAGDKLVHSSDTSIKKALETMMVDTNPGNNSLYIVDRGNVYLKYDTLRYMKKREFVKLLGTSIDIGYTVEDAEWWEKALMVVLVILATYISIVMPPAGPGAFAAIATFAGTLAITLSIASFIMMQVGGLSSLGYVKRIGKFAAVAGVIGLLAGILAALQNLITQAITKEALKEGLQNMTKEQVATEISKKTVSELAIMAIKESFTGLTSAVQNIFTDFSMESLKVLANSVIDSLNGLTTAFNFYQDTEKSKYDKEMNDLKEQDEAYEQEILNKPFMFPFGQVMLMHEKLSTPDMLQDLSLDIDSRIGRDSSYTSWENNVNM